MQLGFLVLITLAVAHYISDFVCQTRWMAQNKSSSVVALGAHILEYTLIFFAVCFAAWHLLALTPILSLTMLGSYAILNGGLHFIVDLISSRLSKKAFEAGSMHTFWVIIGADQLLHNICLWCTFVFLFL